MKRLELTIPGKPVAKGRPQASARVVFSNGKHIAIINVRTPETTVAQESRIADVARAAMDGRPLMSGPIKLLVVSTFEPPSAWNKALVAAALAGRVPHLYKPDWDNLGKVTDALNGIVWTEDSHVVDGRSIKRYGSPARVEVLVEDASFEGMILPPDRASKAPAGPKPKAKTPPPRRRPAKPIEPVRDRRLL